MSGYGGVGIGRSDRTSPAPPDHFWEALFFLAVPGLSFDSLFQSAVMSRYRTPQSLGSVLKEVISSLGIDSKLNDARVVAAWYEIVGERIGREVEKAWMKGDRLIVRIKSPVWRQELHLNRELWCRRLNEELGEERITDIVFR